MRVELGQHPVGAEHEHAAVPQAAPFGEQALGDRALGLLDEALDPEGAVHAGQRLGRRDPAEAGLGPRRRDPEGDEPALRRRLHRLPQGRHEGCRRPDQMVRRADPQRCARPPNDGLGMQGGQRHGRRGVARGGLEQEMVDEGRVDRRELPSDEDCLPRRGDRHQAMRRRCLQGAARGRLQERLLAEQLDQMLGERGTADRPKPRAGTAGKDGRDEVREGGFGHAGGHRAVATAGGGKAARVLPLSATVLRRSA